MALRIRITPTRAESPTPSLGVILAVLLLGTLMRLATASVFDNYDMDSWWIASEAVQAGEPVYAVTHRYNYGPMWSYIIGSLRYVSQLTGADTITRLHLFMTAFLTLSDIGLSLIIYRLVSPTVGFLFFLNPISVIVTGYHIQFDNLAILIGLAGWFIFFQGSTWTSTIVGALLFGASLSMKHIFSVFLAWLPFIYEARSFKHRAAFGAISLCVFLASFLPWLDHSAAWAGIQSNVFAYVSTEGHSLTSFMASHVPILSPRTLFMMLVALSGLVLMRNSRLHRIAPLVYLIALTALSSGMARNYLAVPLSGVFYFLSYGPSMAYILVALAALVTINPSLGVSEVATHISSSPLVTYEVAQCTLLLLLIQIYRRTGERCASRPGD